MEKHIKAPISKEVSRKLRAGDYVYITGTIYTARDAAHKRMDDVLKNGENLPVDMVGQTIYYMGHISSERRASDWFCRSDNCEPYDTVMRRSFWILSAHSHDWKR